MTTTVLADDHHLVRDGVRAVLEAEPDITVVGEAADGLQAVKLVERLKPDVLVADLMMPNLNGLEVTRQISERARQTRVVLLSMHATEAYVLEALRNGATGYVLKDSRAADLIHAVREAAAGRHYLCPRLSERAVAAYVDQAKGMPADPFDTLTTREREVLQLAAQGNTSTEIGAHLSISPRTAEVYRASLLRKLELHTQTDLIRYAIRRGIIPLED